MSVTKYKVKKGDEVIVITGKDSGKTGVILSMAPQDGKVVVGGVNLVTKYTKASGGQPGSMTKQEAPIHISNVAHIDPKTKLRTKVGYRTEANGTKIRFSKVSNIAIS